MRALNPSLTPRAEEVKRVAEFWYLPDAVLLDVVAVIPAKHPKGFKVIFGSDLTGIDVPALLEYELMVLRKGFAKVLKFHEIIKILE